MNVEAQKKFYLKYRIVTRGIFTGARMLSEQLDREFTDSEYGKLKKVYSIWICMNAPLHIGNSPDRVLDWEKRYYRDNAGKEKEL